MKSLVLLSHLFLASSIFATNVTRDFVISLDHYDQCLNRKNFVPYEWGYVCKIRLGERHRADQLLWHSSIRRDFLAIGEDWMAHFAADVDGYNVQIAAKRRRSFPSYYAARRALENAFRLAAGETLTADVDLFD